MRSIDAVTPHDIRHDDLATRDARRLAEIARYGLADLVDAEPRRDLHGLVRLAARLCDAPMAMITFVDQTHLRTIATVGFDAAELPRSASLCNQTLYDPEPLIAGDLAADPRYADSRPVTEGFGRFYVSQQLVTPSGEPIGSLCVFDPEPHTVDDDQREALRDLAERVVDSLELEVRTRDLVEVVDELRRSNEALAAFGAQVSHDLRNPLAALSGSLEVVEDMLATADLDGALPVLRRAHRSVDRMTRLVGDVLELAEVGGALRLREVDTDALVAEVVEDLAGELAEAELRVGALATVVADPVQLRIVVQNLLSNAAKFTHPGGAARLEVGTQVRPGWWRLVVVDHGRGVSPEDRQRIFEPFTRVDPAVPGSGLGLATCRRVARAHGGLVGIDETPGGGTTAWIEIPTDARSE